MAGVSCQADQAIAEEVQANEAPQATVVTTGPTEKLGAIEKQVAIANVGVKIFDEIYKEALAADVVDFDAISDLLRAFR